MNRHKVSIAAYILLVKENKILLARRFQTGWEDGSYSLPAGHVDPNETLAHAAAREALEEVGVQVKEEDLSIVHTMHRMNIYVDFFFLAEKWEGEPRNTEPDKCDDVRWFPMSDLPKNIVPSVKHALEQYQKGITFSEYHDEV